MSLLFIFSNGPVNKPNTRPAATPGLTPESSVARNVSLPPASAEMLNAVISNKLQNSKVAVVTTEGQPLFALGVAPAPNLYARPVREAVQAEVPNARELAKRFIG